ncbi:MAG: DUF418 domain-containing protein [Phycisphaerales bacterium]
MSTPAPLSPVAAPDRLETLDVLRGFALLGILAMNIRAMAAPFSAYMYPYALFDYEGASRAAYVFTSIVFDLKMMGLFSMLFGAGVLLYAAKPTPTGRPPRGLWFRRMAWLLAIGMVHGYLIWDGDILVPYALCGLLFLWWVRRLPAWALLLIAGAFLGIGALIWIGFASSWPHMPEEARAERLKEWMPTREQALEQVGRMQGSYLDSVAHRAPGVIAVQTFVFLMFFLWRCGGMMLLGMGLYKLGFLDGRRSVRTYAVTAAVCIPVGLLMSWQYVRGLEAVKYAMPDRVYPDTWNYVGAVLASIGYAAGLILLVKLGALGWLRLGLGAVGRMAFTNYLSQSIITSVLFLGCGFGLAGKLDYFEQLGVVAAIWAFQLAISPWWLARFRFGPAEWLWRSLTYWRRQPMRREFESA